MTWMDEEFEASFFKDEPMIDQNLEQIDVSDDLYIIVMDDCLDLHSRQFDLADTGVIIAEDELDRLITKLVELRKELDEE